MMKPWCIFVFALATDVFGQEPPKFVADVRPILAKNCFACHGPDEASREADFRIDQPSDNLSQIVDRITSDDPDVVMPPPDSGHKLKPAEIETLTRWMAAGAGFEDHWAFVPPVRPSLPEVTDDGWSQSSIDRFVFRRLAERQLKPSPPADPYTLIRRVSLDLTGLPPTPEEADQFAADPSPLALEAFVDKALASPRFGEHWAAMWLDLARYADTKGYEKDQPRNIWKYRDWVIQAFNDDMPFDQFTREQIAGDLLPDASNDQILATAFHRNTMTNDEGGTDNEEFRLAAVKDRVDTTVQVWMGLTMGCAKCHSHKYDPISHKEYYRFLAFFNQTADADRPDDSPRLPTPTPEQSQQLAELAEQKTAIQGELAAADQAVQPDIKKRLEELEKRVKAIQAHVVTTPVMRDLPAKKHRKTFVHVRGNFLDKGEQVTPGFPQLFDATEVTVSDRRAVADWLLSPQNPLTARVAVNRVWSRLFGRGFVETEEDFGTQGMLPTHPQLLDWMAVTFRDDQQWSLKQLCRSIVLSATYQQSSQVTEENLARDPENRWLGRGSRFRLSAEMVRDQLLFCAGLLSDRIGGPSVMPPQPDGIWRTTYSKLKWQTAEDENRYRRGIYTFLRRTSPYPSMLTFDGTSREVCQIRRIRTNTPSQALVLLNDPVSVEAAGGLARSVFGEPDPLRRMFRRTLIRPPGQRETERLETAYQNVLNRYQADPKSAAAILQQARWDDVSGDQQPTAAALAMMASVLLNLDELVMRP